MTPDLSGNRMRPCFAAPANLMTGFAVVVLSLALSAPVAAEDAQARAIADGRAIAFNRTKGHCLACHAIADGVLPGNVGPVLVAMKARYPDKNALRAVIFDARINNPNTIMPPFGTNRMLTDEEIDKVVEFIHSL